MGEPKRIYGEEPQHYGNSFTKLTNLSKVFLSKMKKNYSGRCFLARGWLDSYAFFISAKETWV